MVNIQSMAQITLPVEEFQSFAQVLQYRATLTPKAEAFRFYNESKCHEEVIVSYSTLDSRARQIAAELSQHAKIGDRCILLYKPSIEYIAAFFACLYVGIIAVPVFMPNLNSIGGIDKLRAILNDCAAKVILSLQEHSKIIEILLSANKAKFVYLFSDNFSKNDISYSMSQELNSEDIAFLQYTSGSTDKPKGVKITHKNLLTNTAIICKQFGFQYDSKGIIWLPPYHDMGLIGGVLAAILGGINLVLTPPITFIQNPLNWLNLISKYGGTISGAPNFAYELCVKQMRKKPLKELDLSSWKVAFCGAEPIRPETLKNFLETFLPYGFVKEAFYPCYGLAESTLMVSCKVPNNKSIVRCFDLKKFNQKIVEEVNIATSHNTIEVVSCGEIISKHDVRIVNPKTKKVIKERRIGEIWVKGNSVANGYWENYKESTKFFNTKLSGCSGDDGWLRTGDLGFFIENELFIAGRLKELIIIHGVNYYPQDIENATEYSHAFINASVAFSVTYDNIDELVIILEIANKYISANLSDVIVAVRKAIVDKFNLYINHILFVKPKSIPRTTSGKIQRILCKRYYLNGKFENIYSKELSNNQILNHDVSVKNIRSIIANYTGITDAQLQACNSLSDLGLDSIQLIELKNNIEEHFKVSVDTYFFFSNLSLSLLLEELIEKIKKQKPSIKNNLKYEEVIPLNPTQNALWLMYKVEPDSIIYNISRCFKGKGEINLACFREAVECLVTEQINLRCTFQNSNEGTFQKIHEKMFSETFNYEDMQYLNNIQLTKKIHDLTNTPFVLEQGPLFKVYIFILSSKEYVLLFVAHHIVVDFWSMNILYKRINELYIDLLKNGSVTLPKFSTYQTSVNYYAWYQSYLESPQYTHDLNFWLKQCENQQLTRKFLNIKGDKNTSFNLFEFSFSKKETEQLKNFCVLNKITPFNLTLVVFSILLALVNKNEYVVIGVPFALRDFLGAQNFVGYCVNLLPFCLEITNTLTIVKVVEKVKTLLFLMLQHKNFPFSHLVEKAKLPRRMDNRLPIFQALFLYQSSQYSDESMSLCALNAKDGKVSMGNFQFSMQPLVTSDSQIELTLSVTPFKNLMRFVVEYETSQYSFSQIKFFVSAYVAVFELIVNRPELEFSSLAKDPRLSKLLLKIPRMRIESDSKVYAEEHNIQYIELEKKLIILWETILNKNNITNQDNFFACGGTSLLAIKLAAEITEVFKIKLDVRSIFRYQTLALLAKHIADLPVIDTSSGIRSIKRVVYEHEGNV